MKIITTEARHFAYFNEIEPGEVFHEDGKLYIKTATGKGVDLDNGEVSEFDKFDMIALRPDAALLENGTNLERSKNA